MPATRIRKLYAEIWEPMIKVGCIKGWQEVLSRGVSQEPTRTVEGLQREVGSDTRSYLDGNENRRQMCRLRLARGEGEKYS